MIGNKARRISQYIFASEDEKIIFQRVMIRERSTRALIKVGTWIGSL